MFIFIPYFIVITLFIVPSFVPGRRAPCRCLCWMVPFMVIGSRIKKLLGYPSLRLRAAKDSCTSCTLCSWCCPMSLDVAGMVQSGAINHDECILCGQCVDSCRVKAISFSFSRSRRQKR